MIDCRRTLPMLFAGLLAAALAGCGTAAGGGYGLAQNNANVEAAMRAQAADKQPAPNDREVYASLIRDMQSKGLYFAALAHIAAYEQKYGSTPAVELMKGDALRETGQNDAARTVYDQLLDTADAAAAWHGLGLLDAGAKNFPSAVIALRNAVARAPTEPLYLNDLGFALLRTGDVAGARVPLAQAAELAPGNGKIIANLAIYLLVAGEPAKARAVMEKSHMPPATREAVTRLAASIRRAAQVRRARSAAAAATHPTRVADATDGGRRNWDGPTPPLLERADPPRW